MMIYAISFPRNAPHQASKTMVHTSFELGVPLHPYCRSRLCIEVITSLSSTQLTSVVVLHEKHDDTLKTNAAPVDRIHLTFSAMYLRQEVPMHLYGLKSRWRVVPVWLCVFHVFLGK